MNGYLGKFYILKMNCYNGVILGMSNSLILWSHIIQVLLENHKRGSNIANGSINKLVDTGKTLRICKNVFRLKGVTLTHL